MTLSIRRLAAVLEAIRRELPGVRRVSSYCLPRNVAKEIGRRAAPIGGARPLASSMSARSLGDDEAASRRQGRDFRVLAGRRWEKLGEAGIKRSVMILNGLGGEALSVASTRRIPRRWMNATQPEFLATLTVSFPMGEARFRKEFPAVGAARVSSSSMQEMEVLLSRRSS